MKSFKTNNRKGLTESEIRVIRRLYTAHRSGSFITLGELWEISLAFLPKSFRFSTNFRKFIKRLIKKDIISLDSCETRDGQETTIVSLTDYGLCLAGYLFPLAKSTLKSPVTTIFVTPEKAAEETGFSLNRIKNRGFSFFTYAVIDHKLFVLKSVPTGEITAKIPTFPTIRFTEINKLPLLFPGQITTSLITRALEHAQTESGWSWPLIFRLLCQAGKVYYTRTGKTKQQKNNNKKEVCYEERGYCLA